MNDNIIDSNPLAKLRQFSPPSTLTPKEELQNAKSSIMQQWQSHWDNATTGRKLHTIIPTTSNRTQPHHSLLLPRQVEVLISRARLNHIYTNEHKHRLFNTTQQCRFCQTQTETTDHLFYHCPFTRHYQLVPEIARLTKHPIDKLTTATTLANPIFADIKNQKDRNPNNHPIIKHIAYLTSFIHL